MKNLRLRDRIELQQRDAVISGYEPSNNWTTYATVWSDKRDPKGTEVSSGLQSNSVMTVVFAIYYNADVTPQHRVKWGSRVFDIQAVTNPDDRGRWLLLHCTEHQSDGD